MKFNEMKYERPNMQNLTEQMTEYLDALEKANSADAFMPIFKTINKCRGHLQTMVTLVQIRHSIDTSDEFYDTENNYWDETLPSYQQIENRFVRICVNAPFRTDLLKSIPETFFKLGECALKSYDPKIIPLLVEENKLSTEYGKLKASAKIPFESEVLNLAQIGAKEIDPDRDVRKKASDAKYAFYAEHKDEFESIYDRMVHVRSKMAAEMGYKNYVELAYYRMNRLDYNADMVAGYRRQILKWITPEAEAIYEKQRKRLGYDVLEYFDLKYEYPDGNATPTGTPDQLVESAVKMYHEMSPETGEFIDLMNNNQLWDLVSRPNKEMGGYTTDILDYKCPFIFSNFNGTSADIDVLTHEAGHAFQSYMSRNIDIPDITFPTMESCEIHSMSMEFFAHPWMNLFFHKDTEKYLYSHTCGTLTFLPYGALVDHFQQEVYENQEWTPADRNACWRRLEKQYLPYKNYDGCSFLEEGCYWFQQNHIFQSPFYYIDYTLAQVCALQFFVRMQKKDPTAWRDYIHLCTLGGTMSFTNLVKEANLTIPFEDGCMERVVKEIDAYLETFNN